MTDASVTASTAINATLPEDSMVMTGVLLPNPAEPPCAVGITMNVIDAAVAFIDPSQPTANPVPSQVSGKVALQLASLISADLPVSCSNPPM